MQALAAAASAAVEVHMYTIYLVPELFRDWIKLTKLFTMLT